MSPNNLPAKIRFAIDRGGTFTDIYAEYGSNKYLTLKLLSEDPQNYPDAPREGIRRIYEKVYGRSFSNHQIDTSNIEQIRMGTTVATNALLERKGAPTALLITKGFKDLLQIGYQNRPNIFDLKIEKPDLLYSQVIEVDERIRPARHSDNIKQQVQAVNGSRYLVLKKPDLVLIKNQLSNLLKSGINGIAIVLMHAYAYPEHELQIQRIATELGFTQISVSSQIMPMIKIVPRGDTTVVDAYLTPHIKTYLYSFQSGFADKIANTQLHFMQSDGGLSPASKFSGSNAILSGPAGGVVGYAVTAYNQSDKKPVIGFDMGGTSTDVSRFDGEFEITYETETAGVRIQAPQIQIKTVAAGGGSCLFFRNGMLSVGPESAGAHPGPICYRKNGYLSITDANLFLGRLQADFFPKIFGENENQPLDLNSVETAMIKITKEINQYYSSTGRPPMSPTQVAAGFVEVANQIMARAIREISTMRGHDIKNHVLATFGGAGGQHACAIAKMLGIKEITINRFSGILSAYGMNLADVTVERQQPASFTYSENKINKIYIIFNELEKSAVSELNSQNFSAGYISVRRYLNLRYDGTDSAFMIKENPGQSFEQSFRDRHLQEFGFNLTGHQIKVDDIRVRALGHTKKKNRPTIHKHDPSVKPVQFANCFFHKLQTTPVYKLSHLGAGFSLNGPVLVISTDATIVVEPDTHISIDRYGDLRINVSPQKTKELSSQKDPVQLTIFSNLFMSIAEQMGRTLQRTSKSTNIKERLDYSCAIFDQHGNLVANAPHIPVHLGAMSAAVKEQIRIHKTDLQPGDVLVTNHPAAGGSHLPDITVISPVWQNNSIIFFTASRGHHADIGGISPGSMPPFSKKLKEEGACIESFKLVENKCFKETQIRELLKNSRKIEDNISDLKAQVAANQKGIDLLLEMAAQYSLDIVQRYMQYIQDSAEQCTRDMLKSIGTDQCIESHDKLSAEEKMDDGTRLALSIEIDESTGDAVFDFTGTGPQATGNWNAPKAVVYSTILYCLHCLAESDLPLNSGCLKPIEVIIPENSILSPSPDAAVVGGNVLTSQRLTDLILKAFQAAAASQGCMNNVTFGNDTFGYYETIGGGAGAGPDWHGQSGVHTHMTNTRITDPEILEDRFPVMLKQFSIRKHSGGNGQFCGGDGLVREYEALETMQMAILSERRIFAPFGLAGGEDGKKGVNLHITNNATQQNIGGKNQIIIHPGECMLIKTPGGGGYGKT